ncbi:MAG: hypothetical protein MI922_22160 [Bacteroidales bacterium]|nr:hypothetical protein [Bacteroidales bacterium]
MNFDLDQIKRSEISNYTGEVFFEELKFVLNGSSSDNIWIRNHGMNSRAGSKDFLDVSNFDETTGQLRHDTIYIHLSRNSIYHQLPETLFHPLTISNSSMSNREVVEAIRENRKKEEENIHFFIPFDTEIFFQKLRLSNRHLNIFTDDYARTNLFSIAKQVLNKNIPLSNEQLYKLFIYLCNSESLKENLPALEEMLDSVLGLKVELKYQESVIDDGLFKELGEGVLGLDLGTSGDFVGEYEDLSVTILLTESNDYKSLEKNISIVKSLLEYFILSIRNLVISYRCEIQDGLTLGTNYLGYDTVLYSSLSKENENSNNEPNTINELNTSTPHL